ncbi:hypothetical protein Efla_004114 [Eimeria flavescens]
MSNKSCIAASAAAAAAGARVAAAAAAAASARSSSSSSSRSSSSHGSLIVLVEPEEPQRQQDGSKALFACVRLTDQAGPQRAPLNRVAGAPPLGLLLLLEGWDCCWGEETRSHQELKAATSLTLRPLREASV